MTERFGRYETLRPIASGGMATVYLGRAVGEGGFERLVAIKVMHPHLASDREFVAMFLDEARLAARIRHPNVVAVFDVQKAPEGMFIVMDYVEGATLSELVRFGRRQGEAIATGMALRIVLDVLTGLHVAHELRDGEGQPLHLIHRDVSPQNVLVGNDGVARLTDFGVARAESRLSSTRGGQLKGKVAYMAPEQIVDDPIDRRADVYAAGAVLWEALVGRRLFRAANDGALVHAIIGGARQSPMDVNPRVPEAISRACMRALASAPEQRFPTAAAFADELEDAARLSGLPIASSRAVATYMAQILPDVERDREHAPHVASRSGASGTPSGISAGRGADTLGSQPSAPSASVDRANAAGLESPASGSALPNESATTPVGEALQSASPAASGGSAAPRAMRSTRRAIAAVAAATVALVAIGVWLLAGTSRSPAASSTAPVVASTAVPSSTTAATEVPSSGSTASTTLEIDAGDETATDPAASSSASAAASEPAAVPRSVPTGRGPRTKATATSPKTSPTSYDPEQL